MPGGAAQTAGMASIAGMAVMIMPSTMKSSNVSATKSGGGRISTLVRTDGRPCTSTTYPPPICQSGSNVGPCASGPSGRSPCGPSTQPCQLALTPATEPAGMVHDRHHDVRGRRRELRLAAHVVELDAERVGDHPHRVPNTAVPARAMSGSAGSSIGRPKPTGISVSGESYPVESADSSTETESTRSQSPADTMIEHVGEPGVDAAAEDRAPPRAHAVDDAVRPSPSEWPVMNAAVDTMLTPASRIRTISSTSGHFGL